MAAALVTLRISGRRHPVKPLVITNARAIDDMENTRRLQGIRNNPR